MTIVVEFYISESVRTKAVEKFTKYFTKSQAKRAETGCFDFTQLQCENYQTQIELALSIYNDTVKNLLFNLQQASKTIQSLLVKINNGKIDAHKLAFLKSYDLNYDKWEKIIRRKTTTEEKLSNRPSIEWKTCVSCKSRDYYYYQLQTRSADEPITTFYICKNCGKTYCINN